MTIARLPALPTRSLIDQIKPHRYVPAHATNVAVTHQKFRRLQAMQARLVPVIDDSDCGEVDAAGTYIQDRSES